MLEWLNGLLKTLLGDPEALAGLDWIEALGWIAAVGAAICAAIALRQQARQSRATLFLSLYEKWEGLAAERGEFDNFYKRIRDAVLKKHSDVQTTHQVCRLKKRPT